MSEIIDQFFRIQSSNANKQTKILTELQSNVENLQKVIQKLQDTCQKQQTQIDNLIKEKHMSLSRKRKIILEYINKPFWTKPNILFEDWYKTIPITFQHLQHVFNYDIVNGVQNCLENYCNVPLLPICCFHQKPGTLYIWTKGNFDEPSWITMSNDKYKKMIDRICHGFLQIFLQWQIENSDLIQSCQEEKDKNISYMHKMNGLGDVYENKRRNQLKNWIYTSFSKEFVINEYI